MAEGLGCHLLSARPRLPSPQQNITVLWPIPNYTAWW